VTAGLLKYYPLVLLVLAAREGAAGRPGSLAGSRSFLAWSSRAFAFYPELSLAAASIPPGASFFHRRPSPGPATCRSGSRKPWAKVSRATLIRGCAAERTIRVGGIAPDASAARARATRLGRGRDAVSRHRRCCWSRPASLPARTSTIAAFFLLPVWPGWFCLHRSVKDPGYDAFAAR